MHKHLDLLLVSFHEFRLGYFCRIGQNARHIDNVASLNDSLIRLDVFEHAAYLVIFIFDLLDKPKNCVHFLLFGSAGVSDFFE